MSDDEHRRAHDSSLVFIGLLILAGIVVTVGVAVWLLALSR